ncbi:MAG TPA: hypothetical protein VFQ23_17365, partial [Anaerolineales bacterium]|nr:hypothetical protein [Anaerolineales bacterium]
MQKIKGSQRILLAYSLFVAIISLLFLRGMILSPSESGSAVFLGLSIPRLVISVGVLITWIFYVAIAVKAARNHEWAEKALEYWFGGGPAGTVARWIAGISFGLGWIGCFLPAYRVGAFGNYWISLRPIMIFIMIVSVATLTVSFIKR